MSTLSGPFGGGVEEDGEPDMLAEWHKMLKGECDLDESEFAFLIPHDASRQWLRHAFGTVPNAETMIERILEVLHEKNGNGMYVIPRKESYLGEQEIKNSLFSIEMNSIVIFWKREMK
jgi:hypothetical protein